MTIEELKKSRHEMCLTQKELAIVLGVVLDTVSSWENARNPIPLNIKDRIYEAIRSDEYKQILTYKRLMKKH